LYVPLVIVVIYAFNDAVGQSWPIKDYTTKWFATTWHSHLVRAALATSLQVASIATGAALLLGSAAAFAVHRFSFFGRNAVSFLLVLPIALPGIVTAIALNSSINTFKIPFSVLTIVIGHATFCIVVVFNNVIARLRRTPGSLVEASMDLGANGWQSFRYVTFPAIRTALISGALLAFALSFDEIVVTNFTSGGEMTIPKFIYNNLRQPRNRPVVNVVAVAVVLLTLIPVYLAQRLAGGPDVTAAASNAQAAQGGAL
jgi:putative spermidine/putrescine transport system permease protein